MANGIPFESNVSVSGDSTQKSKKPSNSAFKQQKLAAWQPILTAGTVLPTFFVIGILFIPVGIGLWYFSDNVQEISIDYTECTKVDTNETCADIIDKALKDAGDERDIDGKNIPDCICKVDFTLEKDFKGQVFIYYGLTNFYQNHRRYVKSRDDNQLYGGTSNPSEDCKPYDYRLDVDGKEKIVWPCGAIANSMFQDEIKLFSIANNDYVPLLRKGIAWESDIAYKFKNPDLFNNNLDEFKQKFIKPKAWKKNPWDLDPNDPSNNGLENEDLIVWMRTAALPNFRKLYRLVNHTQTPFLNGVQNGNYSLHINYAYPVSSFQGNKSIIISTTSLLGGKNAFLGISYVIVGSICLVLGIVFLFIHINCGKSTSEMANIDSRTQF